VFSTDLITSNVDGMAVYVGSSNSALPPTKNLRNSEIKDLPTGLQQFSS